MQDLADQQGFELTAGIADLRGAGEAGGGRGRDGRDVHQMTSAK
jgi:hypothetical protein